MKTRIVLAYTILVALLSIMALNAGAEPSGSPDSTCVVTFQTNGGTAITDVIVISGNSVSCPDAPSRNGYAFDRWYSDEELKSEYDFSSAVYDNMTLYAGWTIVTVPVIVTGGDTPVIAEMTPVLTESEGSFTATFTPLEVRISNTGKTAVIRQSDLAVYAEANGIANIHIITGMHATTGTGAIPAPQVVIMDDSGDTVFTAEALGGQLRYDRKIDGTTVNGKYIETGDKATAIDCADVRLKYRFTIPSNVPIGDVSWSWALRYNSVRRTVNGVKYVEVSGEANTFESNVVVTNIPVSTYQDTDFQATLTVSYTQGSVTYTLEQSSGMRLARSIKSLVKYYKKSSVYSTLSDEVKAYVDAVYDQLEEGSYTPVA